MRGSIKLLDEAITSANVTIAERKQNIEEHNKAEIRPGEEENAESVTTALAEISKKLQEILESISKINAKLIKDAENREKFSQYSDEYDTKMQTMKHWNTLNTLFGSAKGDKLRRLAQGYTLDILLDVANMHLANITKRYKLARISCGSLAIKVIDLDMMSETRSAHSLSGGETFIVSLALSLALSSISSNRMNIGSLFIDEGFGSLDSDTLRTAIMALEKLQSQGRNIGVISHLAEMLEKIPVKVKVCKIAPGKSKIEIVNNG
jgi:exonuclease SbcC